MRTTLILVALTGCYQPVVYKKPQWAAKWPALVVANDCLEETRKAAAYWGHGKFVVEKRSKDDLALNGQPPWNVVAVTVGPTSRPWRYAETCFYGWPTIGEAYSADIRVSECKSEAIAHELGHILGLQDMEDGVMVGSHDPSAPSPLAGFRPDS